MKRYRIWVGFAHEPAELMGVELCENQEEAECIAHDYAVERYQSYEGMDGIPSWYDVARDVLLQNAVIIEDDKRDLEEAPYEELYELVQNCGYWQDVDETYAESIENWMTYYVDEED